MIGKLKIVTACLGFVLLLACSDDQTDVAKPAAVAEPSAEEAGRFSVSRIARGALLFQENCAQCHGPEAQGHPDWKQAKQKGYAAAPPLDGNGPVAQRRKAELIAVIRNGVNYNGKPVMPGWKGRVSDEEIDDVITWFQALWPSNVYAHWQRNNGGTKASVRAKTQ